MTIINIVKREGVSPQGHVLNFFKKCKWVIR